MIWSPFLKDNEMLAELLTPVEGFSLTEQFITMLMSIMAMISTIPALMAMLKIIGEEKKNRTEHLLSSCRITYTITRELIYSVDCCCVCDAFSYCNRNVVC